MQHVTAAVRSRSVRMHSRLSLTTPCEKTTSEHTLRLHFRGHTASTMHYSYQISICARAIYPCKHCEATRCASTPLRAPDSRCSERHRCGKGISRGRTRSRYDKAQAQLGGSLVARPRGYGFTRTITLQCYTEHYAASPLCCFFFAAFSFLAEGLKTETILRMPPRYRYVQKNTTAKLKKMYAHIMPAVLLVKYHEPGKITHTEVSPDVLWEDVETGCERITGSELTVSTGPVGLRFHVPA